MLLDAARAQTICGEPLYFTVRLSRQHQLSRGANVNHEGWLAALQAHVFADDEKATPRVGFGLSQGHPSMSVFDAQGYSAVFGSAPLETNGAPLQTTAAAINMFGSDGTLLWSAP